MSRVIVDISPWELAPCEECGEFPKATEEQVSAGNGTELELACSCRSVSSIWHDWRVMALLWNTKSGGTP